MTYLSYVLTSNYTVPTQRYGFWVREGKKRHDILALIICTNVSRSSLPARKKKGRRAGSFRAFGRKNLGSMPKDSVRYPSTYPSTYYPSTQAPKCQGTFGSGPFQDRGTNNNWPPQHIAVFLYSSLPRTVLQDPVAPTLRGRQSLWSQTEREVHSERGFQGRRPFAGFVGGN